MSRFNATKSPLVLKFQTIMAKSVRKTIGLSTSVLLVAGTVLAGSVVAGELPDPQLKNEKFITEEQQQALIQWSLAAHDVLSERFNEKLQEELARTSPTSEKSPYIRDPELGLPRQELICTKKPVYLPSDYSDKTAVGGC